MGRVFTIGESLLDIIFRDQAFVAANAGGAMLNTAVSLGRAGEKVAMVSELSDDNAGKMVLAFLEKNRVDTRMIRVYNNGKTPLALAALDSEGKARYTFYKDYPAERSLLPFPEPKPHDIVLFGSLYSLSKHIRKDIVSIISRARRSGSTVIYDPNIRANHAREVPSLFPAILENISMSDIVRASDEDLFNIFRNAGEQAWTREVLRRCPVLVITRGGKGVDLHTRSFNTHFEVPEVQAVSTIGAGDSFNAGLIHGMAGNRTPGKMTEADWRKAIARAVDFATDCCLHSENYISEKFSSSLPR